MNALVLNDLDVTITEEVLEQLAMEDTLTSKFGTQSLNAMVGTDAGEAIKIRALLKNKVMLILLDSGSSHSFISSALLAKVGIKLVPMPPKVVKVANGDSLIANFYVPQLEWWTQGHAMNTNMMVLDLDVYDAILGYDWLKSHSPMNCHWANRTVTFKDKGKDISIQGVQSPLLELKEIKHEQLGKWAAGTDISAFVIVEPVPDIQDEAVPSELQVVLEQYKDVFADPRTLPPERLLDHSIPLLSNVVPVNCKPYRYSPLHKNEIEKQVKQLLTAGLIVPSTSPFASPVLLVQKKDGSWRFCVDYKKLNEIIVKAGFLC
jgi:hypothetical protein